MSELNQRFGVRWRQPGIESLPRESAVDDAGVEELKAQLLRQQQADATLADCYRPVDGDKAQFQAENRDTRPASSRACAHARMWYSGAAVNSGSWVVGGAAGTDTGLTDFTEIRLPWLVPGQLPRGTT